MKLFQASLVIGGMALCIVGSSGTKDKVPATTMTAQQCSQYGAQEVNGIYDKGVATTCFAEGFGGAYQKGFAIAETYAELGKHAVQGASNK